jgi:hypothetical protein
MKYVSALSIQIAVLVYCLAALLPQVTLCQNSIYEDKYPNHLQAYKLLKTQRIVIDGKLNDDAWQRTAKFQDNKFVDITKHLNVSLNKLIPSTFQVDVATLYDDEYLYIGARVYEPFQYGTITGHNIQAPYHDNDFEVFIDVSGTTEYYKEFEMNILNATYDVNWGVPDQDGLNCDKSANRSSPYIPVCVNTTFPSYSGNWSMQYSSSLNGSINSSSPSTVTQGLQTATSYNKATFGKYLNNNFWTLEIAFPIKSSSSHGGLLDKDLGTSYPQDKFHPAFYYLKNNLKRPPLYWLIDFARAEHPRKYVHKTTNESVFCPFDCTHVNEANYNVTLTNPTSEECEFVQKQYPTLLGHSPWNCYFEWVFQDVGDNNYMHRPSEWAFLEFIPSSENDSDNDDIIVNVEVCKNIEFVGRHVMKLIHKAEKAYFDKNNNTYTEDFSKLLQYCGSVSECEDLQLINVRKDIFPSNIRLNVTENISKFTENCTNRPCFQAGLFVVAPLESGGSSEYIITMTDNLLIQVKHFEGAKNRDTGRGDLKLCLK